MEATATCSRGARLPLRHCRQLQRSSPFLSWFGHQQLAPKIMSLSPSHSDPRTVPRLSKHPRRLEHCWRFRYLRVTTVHPPSLNTSRSPGGEPIKQESLPRYPRWSVSSSSSVQQPSSLVSSHSGASCSKSSNPSFTGPQPRGVPNRSAKVACEAFSHAFGLSSTLAFALAFPLGFLNVPSCFLRLLPRLAVARRILSLWCALPLSSRGRFLGLLTRFPVPLLLPFEAELSVSTIALKDSASFWTELVSLPPSLTSSAKSYVISLSFSWTSGGG